MMISMYTYSHNSFFFCCMKQQKKNTKNKQIIKKNYKNLKKFVLYRVNEKSVIAEIIISH